MRSLIQGRIWSIITKTVEFWGRFECGALSAAVAFYAAVSLFPLMIVLVSGVGIFFEFIKRGQDAREAVLEFFGDQVSPEFSNDLAEIFAGIQSGALINGPIAAVGFLIPASLAFNMIARGFDRIWEVRTRGRKGFGWTAGRFALNRLLSLVMVAGMGLLVVLVFFGGTVVFTIKEALGRHLPQLGTFWGTRSYFLSLIVTTLAYGLVYHILAKGRANWKACFMSGLAAGVLWEIGRGLIAELVIGQRFNAYGIVGSFLAILLWVYYASMVLFVGALLARAITDRWNEEGETKALLKLRRKNAESAHGRGKSSAPRA